MLNLLYWWEICNWIYGHNLPSFGTQQRWAFDVRLDSVSTGNLKPRKQKYMSKFDCEKYSLSRGDLAGNPIVWAGCSPAIDPFSISFPPLFLAIWGSIDLRWAPTLHFASCYTYNHGRRTNITVAQHHLTPPPPITPTHQTARHRVLINLPSQFFIWWRGSADIGCSTLLRRQTA